MTDPMIPEEPALVRSYLQNERPATTPLVDSDDEPMVRAYLITNGRTDTLIDLAFESMVSLVDSARNSNNFSFERANIINLCRDGAQSLAEIAAKLRVPIGTARVLAGDLIAEHVLNVHVPNSNLSNDVALLKRLINGVHAL
jgi:hypothetical protein